MGHLPIEQLLEWYRLHARDLPWRRTRDPYAVWVSEVMLQQTQVKTVIPYWTRWMQELPHIGALAEASEQKLLKLWEGLGYYSRVRNLQKAARQILEFHQGTIPRTDADLLALPGVGRYTAGAIASIAFNQPAAILDGNVIRVLTRFYGMDEPVKARETTSKLWALALHLVERAAKLPDPLQLNCSHCNQALMELGATVCLPSRPSCTACPLARDCLTNQQGRQASRPNLAKRAAPTSRRLIAFILERQGKVLVRQRPGQGVNAGLWEFPHLEATDSQGEVQDLARQTWGLMLDFCEPLCTIKHSITRYRITLEVHRAGPPPRRVPDGLGEWRKLEELPALPFASAHGRICKRLLAEQEQKARRVGTRRAAKLQSSDNL